MPNLFTSSNSWKVPASQARDSTRAGCQLSPPCFDRPQEEVKSKVYSLAFLIQSPSASFFQQNGDSFLDARHVFHPHERCGCSDSPFARICLFYAAGFSNGLAGVGIGAWRVDTHKMKESRLVLIQNQRKTHDPKSKSTKYIEFDP